MRSGVYLLSIILLVGLLLTTAKTRHRHKSSRLSSICDTAKSTGIYTQRIYSKNVKVRCDVSPKYGKWLVIQRRLNGKVNFFRGWMHYVNGFGDLKNEFWLGLDNIHHLTTITKCRLQVRLTASNGNSSMATFSQFKIDGQEKNYMLSTLGESRGDLEDRLLYHLGQPFSTYDRYNNMDNVTENCAISYAGAWWYNKCFQSNLNARYTTKIVPEHLRASYMMWASFTPKLPLIVSEMMLRPSHIPEGDDEFKKPTTTTSNWQNY